MGGLFEPRTTNTNQLVFDEAVNIATSQGDGRLIFRIGINDLATQGQHDHTFGPQKSKIIRLVHKSLPCHFRNKLFIKIKLSKNKSWAPKLIFSNEILQKDWDDS